MSILGKFKKFSLIVFLTLSCSLSLIADRGVSLHVELDSANVMMGSCTYMTITLQQEKNVRGHFPIFKNVVEKGYVSVCGDSVELRAPVKSDTLEKDNILSISYKVPVQSFDSGYYKLPSIEFVSGVDTVKSNILALTVKPFPGVTAETPIADYANVADPENPSIFDSLPDWMVDYWWILVILLAIIVFGFYLFKKYKKQGYLIPKKPEPTPYEVAITAFHSLKEKKLWETGMEKEYFTELTDILRRYMEGRFGINAIEMTSRQILSALSANPETKEKRGMIRQILDMADFVKFAKVRPLPADNIASFDNALKFVEETKPVEKEEISASGNNSSTIKKGGNK